MLRTVITRELTQRRRGAQRLRRGLGEAVHDTFDPIPQSFDVEVEQEPDGQVGQHDIGQRLGSADRMMLSGRLCGVLR